MQQYYGFDDEFISIAVLNSNQIEDSLALDNYLTSNLQLCPEKYEISKNIFKSCDNMLDFLKVSLPMSNHCNLYHFKLYNMTDVQLLCEGISNYANGFLDSWNMNIHDFMSLPGAAENLAYRFYKEGEIPIFTFGKDFGRLNEEIRKQLHG